MILDARLYYPAIHEIIRTGHWITDQVSLQLKEFKITEPQFNVLRILRGQKGDPITVQQIQDDMVQRTSNVTRIIDKLLAKGLVQRHECKTNRRKLDITLTPRGNELLMELNKKVHLFHEPMMKNLSASEAETLVMLLKKLKGNI